MRKYRIRDLREDLDLRQKDVAELLNVGQKTYSDYELGKSRIPVDSIIILAEKNVFVLIRRMLFHFEHSYSKVNAFLKISILMSVINLNCEILKPKIQTNRRTRIANNCILQPL